jgi:hypothetical protein
LLTQLCTVLRCPAACRTLITKNSKDEIYEDLDSEDEQPAEHNAQYAAEEGEAAVTTYKSYASEAFSSARKLKEDEDRSKRA